jgi:hypothetical protein
MKAFAEIVQVFMKKGFQYLVVISRDLLSHAPLCDVSEEEVVLFVLST